MLTFTVPVDFVIRQQLGINCFQRFFVGSAGIFKLQAGHTSRPTRSQLFYSRNFLPQSAMPLHYPRYTKADYETMPEWRLDCLLQQYGLPLTGDLHHKRHFAIGAFLWP
ncbi:Nucleotide-sugar transporter [Senna tora]|uniref:Nucleotide-sugar transporter n=1 Tax=Senna tora TaxID=362788 RepID=A0A834WKD3_9FABA|nr:Nucleotide-sugar transporter [Senna tora]